MIEGGGLVVINSHTCLTMTTFEFSTSERRSPTPACSARANHGVSPMSAASFRMHTCIHACMVVTALFGQSTGRGCQRKRGSVWASCAGHLNADSDIPCCDRVCELLRPRCRCMLTTGKATTHTTTHGSAHPTRGWAFGGGVNVGKWHCKGPVLRESWVSPAANMRGAARNACSWVR